MSKEIARRDFIAAAIVGTAAASVVLRGEAVAADTFKGGSYSSGESAVIEQGMKITISDDSTQLGKMVKEAIERNTK